METKLTRKRVGFFVLSGCLLVFGFLGRLATGVYLISYEDNWQPEDGPFLTLASMNKNEQIAYITGAYLTPLMMLCGLFIGIRLLWLLYRKRKGSKPSTG